jgi:putative oxidoreductase
VLRNAILVVARVAFGAKFAKDGFENLTDTESMVAYAEGAGVPMPELLVPAASFVLFAGGLLLALGLAPLLGVVAIATFLLGVTPEMHDFWNREDDEERQTEREAFTRNATFLAGAIAFAAAVRDGGD